MDATPATRLADSRFLDGPASHLGDALAASLGLFGGTGRDSRTGEGAPDYEGEDERA
ncbi:MAG: hypothetical protein ABEJ05_08790 [Haloglomus sp.]